MDFESSQKNFEVIFENRPTRDVFEKILLEAIIERNKVVAETDNDKRYLEMIDKVIESIQIYLSVASK
jgi:hypothetical protein